MGIQTIVKEMALDENMIQISVAVFCDEYKSTARAPRIEMKLSCKDDSRRMVIPVNTFEFDKKKNKGVAYATYLFDFKVMFWNCKWQDCEIHFDVQYMGKTYCDNPITLEFATGGNKDTFKATENSILIHMPEEVDNLKYKDPNVIQSSLAILFRILNMLLSAVLLPWFCIDVFCMMFFHIEKLDENVKGPLWKQYIFYVGWDFFNFGRNRKGFTGLKSNFLTFSYLFFNSIHPNKKEILFLSNRRQDLTGNFEYVYKFMKDDPKLKISFWLHPEIIKDASFGMNLDLARKAARAKIIIVDDHIPLFEFWKISDKTQVVQLWHACGAFKTFGISRLGKKGAPTQRNTAHRNYARAFVSSKNIAKYYAEGFGIAEEKVLSLGIPRTDMFFDENAKTEIIARLYQAYPQLKDKKVIMFAPTFRGDGKNSAYYEKKRFDPNKMIAALPEEYVLIIKHHPFVSLTYKIQDKYKDRVFDFSKESEINELLFITDILITDYSSVVYEASLLNIPMLFYAYDLENYVATRDFYSEFEYFVPGKITRTQKELVDSILKEDFEHEKVQKFCEDNFDLRDGQSSKRVVEYIKGML